MGVVDVAFGRAVGAGVPLRLRGGRPRAAREGGVRGGGALTSPSPGPAVGRRRAGLAPTSTAARERPPASSSSMYDPPFFFSRRPRKLP